MKLFGKLSLLSLALTFPLLVSCDGDSGSPASDPADSPEARAKTLRMVENDDTFRYVDTTGPAVIDELVIGDTDSVEFVYSKTGEHTFNISFTNTGLTLAYNEAVETLLGDIGGRFRQRLLDPGSATEPSFTRTELQSFADDLVAEGAFVYLHPTQDRIFSADEADIDHVSNSTNAELLKGEMDGTFTLTARGRFIYFRRANDADALTIRNLTSSYWVPVLSEELVSAENFLTGRFTLELGDDDTVVAPQ